MKTIILAGGRGTRLGNESDLIPKPMIQIGSIPIIKHLMNIYSHYNFKNFILCLGYKQEIIRDYFLNYNKNNSDLCVNLKTGGVNFYNTCNDDLNISLIDTGENTLTGSRLLKVKRFVENDDLFLVNYSDGLANVDLNDLVEFHKSHGRIATMTAVKKKGKFGTVELEGSLVTSFFEKPLGRDYINGGFFVFSKEFFNYLIADDLPITLDYLAKQNQLMAYKFEKQWSCIDTINDKIELEKEWESGNAHWKI